MPPSLWPLGLSLLTLLAQTHGPSDSKKTQARASGKDGGAALVDRMQAFYRATTEFSADFKQVYTYKSFNRTQTSSGRVIFKKPGKMRWDYAVPSPKTFVISGNYLYTYDPEAKTLTKAAVDADQLSTSVTFLWGRGNLADEFSIKEEPCNQCIGRLLVLTPRKHDARYRELRLEVDPKSAQVLRSTVIDPDQSENAIEFLNLKRNIGIADKDFAINPPDGTEIVDMTKKR